MRAERHRRFPSTRWGILAFWIELDKNKGLVPHLPIENPVNKKCNFQIVELLPAQRVD
jgi:hypothetical protein